MSYHKRLLESLNIPLNSGMQVGLKGGGGTLKARKKSVWIWAKSLQNRLKIDESVGIWTSWEHEFIHKQENLHPCEVQAKGEYNKGPRWTWQLSFFHGLQ